MAKEILVAYGVDVDAVAGWLGSYGGENSPDDISRGLFAGEVGTPRLLKLFERYDLKTTWFIPGHSIETFPAETEQVVDAGHEIGIHGYTHENPIAMTREQETAVLDKCIGLVEQVSGKRPTGYVAPWWEFSNVTNELLLERGIKYDHSLMHQDFLPYYVRVGDSWTKIDYAKRAEEWMVPLQRGEETDLIEIPASWYLDDLPPMMFIKTAPNSHGFVNPRDIEQLWMDQFDWVYREYDYAVFTMTIHPDVSGRPAVLAMHERIIEHINGHSGVRWATFDEIADDFAQRSPRGGRSGLGRLAARGASGVAATAGRVRCLDADPAAGLLAELLLDAVHRCAAKTQAQRHGDEHDEDQRERDGGRPGAQRVEVRQDRPALRPGADQDRQRLGLVAALEQDRAVEVVPGEREAEEEAAEDPGPDERQRHLAERASAPFAPRSRAASSTWRSYRFQTASMTRNANGIPQMTLAPSAVYHRFGVYPMNFHRSWLPRPDEEGRGHQGEHEDEERDRVALQPPPAAERHREREPEHGDEHARDDRQVERLATRCAHVVRDRVEEIRVPQRPPPVEADRPAERERQLTRVALEGEDRHQDHRDVEEEEEQREVRAEAPLRPVPALLHVASDDDVLRAREILGRGCHRLDHRSSRRFERRVITQTPIISTATSSTADAAPCGYWTAPIFE